MCTTIGYRSSTAQRSLVTHTADCKDCDFRVNKVPAAQHDLAKSPNRPIYKYHNLYPRIVAEERGSTWSADNLETAHAAAYAEPDSVASQIVGYLPEVEYTYGTFESLFGMMNDQQVAIGESTCAARFGENAIVRACVGCDGPLFEMSALTMIALERCATARCAVQMMGDLAVEHGFYGAETVEDERGEALTVSDTDEVWMFHISPDPSATSAIWVAQRVSDGHITAAANAFVIRGVKKDHPDFLYSENLWSAAESEGVLRTIGDDNDLDFTATYGPDEFAYHPDGTRDNKSMKKPEYCTDRVWRVLSLAAPSLNLKRETDFWGNGIPFSVPADKDLTVQDIMAMNRDHYEGVEGMVSKCKRPPSLFPLSPPLPPPPPFSCR
jgi:dipeptidase